jgi:hypothetical protein
VAGWNITKSPLACAFASASPRWLIAERIFTTPGNKQFFRVMFVDNEIIFVRKLGLLIWSEDCELCDTPGSFSGCS